MSFRRNCSKPQAWPTFCALFRIAKCAHMTVTRMSSRPRANWDQLRNAVRPPLLAELERVFHAKYGAMLCAMSHGQLTIDGYIIRPEHLNRWTRDQLIGRYAELCGRTAQLYGSAPISR